MKWEVKRKCTKLIDGSQGWEEENVSSITCAYTQLNILSVAFPGDGNTIPTRFNNTRKEKESSERRVSIESIPRTDHKSFDNGGNIM